MFNPITTAKIFSQLGSNSSLLPMIVKDSAHSAGMTTASYVAGKEVEGKDRFIDEIGAEAIWVGGIPFYKKVIDFTLYQIAKYNPKVDIRILKDKNILDLAIKHAPTLKIQESMMKIIETKKTKNMFKGLFLAKFIAATAMTLGSYGALTSFRHKHTEKSIIKEFRKEEVKRKAKEEYFKGQNSPSFKAFSPQKQKAKNPSFGMNLASLKDFMFNPVKNMMIVDGGITAERLGESRNPQDFMGYVIKEGSFWAFMYFAGAKIQKHFEHRAEKKHDISINLDIKVLQDKELHDAFKNKTVMEGVNGLNGVKEFNKIEKPEKIYEFLCTNKDNLVIKMAKTSGIIKTCKNEEGKIVVDTQHYIDLEEVKGVSKKLEKLYKQFESSKGKTEEKVEEFLAKTVKLKRLSIIKNIGTCMGVLGIVVPGVMLAMRYINKDNQEFQVKKEIHEKLKNKDLIKG